jgi:hypothetical protein
MQQYKGRVRKMRPDDQHHGRSTDGTRQSFRDDAIIRAKAAAQRAAQAESATTDQEDQS